MPTILVVEDETQVRSNIQDILELSDYQVLTAANGELGLQLAQSHSPDLILCDIMMPGMDGYQALAALRETESTANIPVILLTAKAERSDQRQGMELGADDYITKPFTPDELLGAIAIRLKRHALFHQQLQQERHQLEQHQRQAQQTHQQVQQTQQLADIKDNLLGKLVQDLRDPLSNINMAIQMLHNAKSDQQRDRYLKILRDECDREIQLLNEIAELQSILTPENAAILQRFNLLNRTP